ncbi:hypothetical protein [Niallia taxi]|uniref:hypothetical protein n=1 Tax=Niallia taxi TaxID=2499688 RepID=UPI002E1C605C|nr:hypothetical protein [Niallia taxi]
MITRKKGIFLPLFYIERHGKNPLQKEEGFRNIVNVLLEFPRKVIKIIGKLIRISLPVLKKE